jgi:hypothetical protein
MGNQLFIHSVSLFHGLRQKQGEADPDSPANAVHSALVHLRQCVLPQLVACEGLRKEQVREVFASFETTFRQYRSIAKCPPDIICETLALDLWPGQTWEQSFLCFLLYPPELDMLCDVEPLFTTYARPSVLRKLAACASLGHVAAQWHFVQAIKQNASLLCDFETVSKIEHAFDFTAKLEDATLAPHLHGWLMLLQGNANEAIVSWNKDEGASSSSSFRSCVAILKYGWTLEAEARREVEQRARQYIETEDTGIEWSIWPLAVARYELAVALSDPSLLVATSPSSVELREWNWPDLNLYQRICDSLCISLQEESTISSIADIDSLYEEAVTAGVTKSLKLTIEFLSGIAQSNLVPSEIRKHVKQRLVALRKACVVEFEQWSFMTEWMENATTDHDEGWAQIAHELLTNLHPLTIVYLRQRIPSIIQNPPGQDQQKASEFLQWLIAVACLPSVQ